MNTRFLFCHIHLRYVRAGLFEAVEPYDSLLYTHITVFSIERFSDWSVHQASHMEQLHEVTIERLKY